MISYIKKDISTIIRGVVAHGCNCQGVMGSGVAFAIRRKWSKAYTDYVSYCRKFDNNRRSMLGMVQMVNVGGTFNDLFVANCFTQEYYGNDGKVYADLSAIKEALQNVIAFARTYGYPVYIPRIGCGLGGLSWEDQVQPILEQLVDENEIHPVEVFVCDLQQP